MAIVVAKGDPINHRRVNTRSQQTLSNGPINISLRTITISCDYLRCRVIALLLHWIRYKFRYKIDLST